MEINVCPSLLVPGFNSYSPMAMRQLFANIEVSPFLDFDFDKDIDRQSVAVNVGRISVSGVQEKMSAVIDGGCIRLSNDGEMSTHILKPAPLDYDLTARRQVPANEHLTMQIASQVYGITTAANGLCFDSKRHAVYITKRFDILPDGKRAKMEDFASLCNRNEQTDGRYFKYSGCYEELAQAIKTYIAAWPVAIADFFKLLLFNYIYANGDAHMKNFSAIHIGGELVLAPAYDLMNTCLHLAGDDLGLSGGLFLSGWKSEVFDHTGHPCKIDFEKFGIHIGIAPRRVQAAIQEFAVLPELAVELIGRSFLDKKMKRKYLAIVNERLSRFNRTSSD